MHLPIAGDSAFFLELYRRYCQDRGSVPLDWQIQFEALEPSPPDAGDGLARRLVDAYRAYGHLEADVDPLGLVQRPAVPLLDTLRNALADRAGQEAAARIGGRSLRTSLGDLDGRLRAIYAGPIGLEAGHILDEAERDWLYEACETMVGAGPDPAQQARALESIAVADEFERFAKVKFPSKKRFGCEGAEALIVILRELVRESALEGFSDVVMGGMHRGRLATLATVLGKPVGVLLAEIKGRDLTGGGPSYTGDVPYHLGYAGELEIEGHTLRVEIAPHPSHLLTVAPVALGQARAKRRDAADTVLSVLLHTDAAFAGQGLTAEVMQLGGLAGYTVGGTVHLVVNNQLGFTTNPSEARSAYYCTDVGKMVGAPVLHVNGDRPEQAARAAQLALAYRRRFRKDVLIDLVCYRRNGHNELDEPRFTQPMMRNAIDGRPSLRESYGAACAAQDPAMGGKADAAAAALRQALEAGYAAIDSLRPNAGQPGNGAWAGIPQVDAAALLQPVVTGLPLDALRALGRASSALPAGIAAHAKVQQFYRARADSYETGEGINLASAEALAIASLLRAGVPVRLSGQDTVRGTFTQRHLAVHDMETGAAALPLAALATAETPLEAFNSPLSEYSVLGFEYGISTADPRRLVMWEAQFGDFLNGAQIAVDQYIVSAEAKWGMMSGLVMLLPHGLEGQGPDHSSARIERILQLCAGGNVVVANPSTPANLFHLLRRQILAPWRKPLFVIAPKSLLRHKACVSTLAEMGPGTGFRLVIGDAAKQPRRVVLCSGKIYYELLAARPADVALVRIEQLYPFPGAEIAAALKPFGKAERVWCQEEPENQGAWDFVSREFMKAGLAPPRLVSRPALPVAAGGSIERHEIEQQELVAAALA